VLRQSAERRLFLIDGLNGYACSGRLCRFPETRAPKGRTPDVKVVDGKKEHRGKNLPRTFVRTEDGSGHKANGGPGRL
jgi:hypothetical protein